MRRTLALLSILALLLAVAAPATAGDAGASAGGHRGSGPRIGLVTDGGSLADKGFNEYAWAGVQAGAEAVHGSAEAIVPPPNPLAYAWGIDWLAAQGFDVIVTVGFLMADVTLAEAPLHPDIQFFGVDQTVPDVDAPSNYQGLLFDEAEAGYLAGIVAATLSTTGTIGAVGGMQDIAPVLGFINGYRNGARSVDSEISVLVTYTEDFARPDLGYGQATDLFTNQGGDIVFAVAGGTNVGVFAAACDAGMWSIGVDVDSYLAAPAFQSCIVTSAEKRIATMTSLAIERFATEGYQSGKYVNDAANGGIGLAPIRNVKTPKGLHDALGSALAGLADGSIDPCQPTACSTP